MSDREYPLYTIKNNCVDCYKCVRRCPVKAIKIEDGSARLCPTCALPAVLVTGSARPKPNSRATT